MKSTDNVIHAFKSVYVIACLFILSCSSPIVSQSKKSANFKVTCNTIHVRGEILNALLFKNYLIFLIKNKPLFILDTNYRQVRDIEWKLKEADSISEIAADKNNLILQMSNGRFIVLDSTLNRVFEKESILNKYCFPFMFFFDRNIYFTSYRNSSVYHFEKDGLKEFSNNSFFIATNSISKSFYNVLLEDEDYQVQGRLNETIFFQKHTGNYFMLPLTCGQLFRQNGEFYFIVSNNGGCFTDHTEFLRFENPALFFPVKKSDSTVSLNCINIIEKWWDMTSIHKSEWLKERMVKTYYNSLSTCPLITFLYDNKLYSATASDSMIYILEHGDTVRAIDSIKASFYTREGWTKYSYANTRELSWRTTIFNASRDSYDIRDAEFTVVHGKSIDILQTRDTLSVKH